MKGRPGGPDGPEDVDAAFAEIIADLEREGLGANVTAEPLVDAATEEAAESGGPDEPESPRPDSAAWRGHDADWDWSFGSEDEHYEPPEPPPLPRLRPVTILAITLLVVGFLLLIAPGLLGLAPRLGTPMSLIALAFGAGLLLLRIRQNPPSEEADDNGAQV